jgi:hypothetical protein
MAVALLEMGPGRLPPVALLREPADEGGQIAPRFEGRDR